jgi:hypothetical protein
MPQMIKNKAFLRIAGFAIPFIVILPFLVSNFFFSVNFPFQDDFLLIQFIEVISNGSIGFVGVVKELFRTFNDHKAVIPRLIALIEYSITGVLNFRFYIVLVSLNITYIFYFIYVQFRKTSLPAYYFLPAFFMFFHPLYHEISGWALNGMQHSFLIAFTVSAIALASRKTDLALAGAILCCFFATFTHGNGILSFPAIVFYFLCIKDFKRALLTIAGMFTALFIYLIGYESGQAMRLPESLTVFLNCLLGFMGSVMAIFPQPLLLSAVLGLVIVGILMFQLFKIVKNYFGPTIVFSAGMLELLSLLVFVFITGFVIATFRSWAGADSAMASRFQIYSCISLVIVYIWLVNTVPLFRKKSTYAIVLGLSVFYWAYSYYSGSKTVGNKKTAYLADVYNWEVNKNLFTVPRQLRDNASFYLDPAYQKGFFRLPEPVVSQKELDSLFTSTADASEDYQMFIDVLEIDRKENPEIGYDHYFYVVSNILPKPKKFLTDRFAVFRNKETGKIYLRNGDPKVESRKAILTKFQYYKPGFNIHLRPDDLESGNYEMAILDVEANGQKSFYKLDRSLQVQNKTVSLH